MNVADVISRVKRQFGDESGAQITDADIMRWISDAQNEIALSQKLFEAEGSQTTIPGTADYLLPSSVVELNAVYLGGRTLTYLAEREFDEYIRRVNEGNYPSDTEPCFYTSWGNRISLYPSPSSAESLQIRFVAFPAPVAGTTDELALPLRYHNRIVELVLFYAYQLDEQWDAAQLKNAEYMAGMQQQAGDEQWDGRSEYPSITVLAEDL